MSAASPAPAAAQAAIVADDGERPAAPAGRGGSPPPGPVAGAGWKRSQAPILTADRAPPGRRAAPVGAPRGGRAAPGARSLARGPSARGMTSRTRRAVSLGVLPTLTPAFSRASFLAWAVPEEPETIAPAWPIVLPSGAVKPAT